MSYFFISDPFPFLREFLGLMNPLGIVIFMTVFAGLDPYCEI
jgi:hypothetical protein